MSRDVRAAEPSYARYRMVVSTALVAAAMMLVRWGLWTAGVHGLALTPLVSAIVSAGVFVVGLVVAGLLADYKAAERTPTELAASLYAVLRESESAAATWHAPDLGQLRTRLVRIVQALQEDIADGSSRRAQEAVEALSESIIEMDRSEIPANYVVRMRTEQAAMRKTVLQIYYVQREQFLPSAKTMIVSMIVIILTAMTFTDFDGLGVSLVTVGFLTFFFAYLLRILAVIDRPFRRRELSDGDDVSLFLLTEFVVHASAGEGGVDADRVEQQAERLEERADQS